MDQYYPTLTGELGGWAGVQSGRVGGLIHRTRQEGLAAGRQAGLVGQDHPGAPTDLGPDPS